MSIMYCHHHHIPHLLLLYEDSPDLCCNHGDNGGDVIFKAVREAASSRHTVLVKIRHMLSDTFYLVDKKHKNEYTLVTHAHCKKGRGESLKVNTFRILYPKSFMQIKEIALY